MYCIVEYYTQINNIVLYDNGGNFLIKVELDPPTPPEKKFVKV